MYNDVSRNTFSIKFIKLLALKHKFIKESLIQNLRQAIDLYFQSKNIAIDLELIYPVLKRKVALIPSQSSAIIYRCTIAFSLAKYVSLSPTIIAKELVAVKPIESCLEFKATIIGGRIDFCCEALTLAAWLDSTIATFSSCQLLGSSRSLQEVNSTKSHFPIQYAHARCCSWLRLGERENLISLSDRDFTTLTWQIARPNPIVWFDTGNFYLTHSAEYNLLFWLLRVVESTEAKNWLDIALNLSEAMLVFEAKCRIFGAVKQNCPQQAIARLGLVALVQYCLQKLLTIELGAVALTKL